MVMTTTMAGIIPRHHLTGESPVEMPETATEFSQVCQETMEKVTDDNMVDANEMPLSNDNGKRKIQMDKDLKTWLVESDGTKKAISR